jgi:hypothetical protein
VAARFSVIVGLTLSVLAGFGAQRLLDLCRTRASRRAVLALLVGAIAVDLWPRLELEHVWDQPPSIYGRLAPSTTVVLAEFPFRWHSAFDEFPYEYFSLWHWLPMVNGYSGFTPVSYEKFVERLEHFPDPDSLDALRGRGVTHVSVNCALYNNPDGCRELVQMLDERPDFHRVVAARWEGQPVVLYVFTR